MLGAELSQRTIMAVLGDQNARAWPVSIDFEVHAQPFSHRLGLSRWAAPTEQNLETDERSKFAIGSAARAARMDKVHARITLFTLGQVKKVPGRIAAPLRWRRALVRPGTADIAVPRVSDAEGRQRPARFAPRKCPQQPNPC
jgi:hypothetical protein